MRAGLSTIHQTLTPEAASVLNQSIAEAARRGHSQTTPLHVAATLLASPAGLFRQACVRSHPNSSHPLQCRALELCFSVALDRLPSSAPPPPNSNPPAPSSSSSVATVGQLGVLRSPLTTPGAPLLLGNKNLYLNPRLQQQQQGSGGDGGSGSGAVDGFEQHRREEVKRVLDVLLRAKKRNPVLVSDSEPEMVVKEVLQRIQTREVGEGPLRNVEVISLEKQLASDRSQIPLKLQELRTSIDLRLKSRAPGDAASAGGVILDLGDLKWLVESPGGGIGGSLASAPIHQQQKVVLEVGRAAVAEMAKLLGSFADSGGQIWLIGTATCATYLRCQVYHPTMENDWDLQAVPITAGAPLPGAMFPRINGGGKGILSSSVESLSVQKGFPPMGVPTTAILARRPPENTEATRRPMCPACSEGYERELAKLVAGKFEKSSAESKPEPRQALPPWLQLANLSNANAKPAATQLQAKEQEPKRKQSTEELLKRWTATCSRLHPSAAQARIGHDKPATPLLPLPMPSMQNSNLLLQRQKFPAKPQPALGCNPLLASKQSGTPATIPSGRHASPPGSPVRTDLVLGRAKPPPVAVEKSLENAVHRERLQDPAGCTQDSLSERSRDRVVGNLDLDSFKRLFKGLTGKVSWQPEAASLVAATVIQCKSGDSKRQGAGGRGDAWLLFMGPDRVGKKKMAMALSELVAGSAPVTISFGDSKGIGDNAGPDAGFRGKTALDRVVEAVRRNPVSVVVLEDVDRANMVVQGSLRRAMERGRLPDSHGREVALGSVIFILISQTLPENLKSSIDALMQCEEKLSLAACTGIQVELVLGENPVKRRADWGREEDDPDAKPRKRVLGAGAGLSLDLNLAAGCQGDAATTECSPNSSDLTVENEHNECGRLGMFNRLPGPSISELASAVDEAVVFKPVDFGELRRKVSDAIAQRFASVVRDGRCLRVDEAVLDRLVAGVWFGETPAAMFDDWAEKVLVPGFQQVRGRSAADGSPVVRLLLVKDGRTLRGGSGAGAAAGEWLPREVVVAMDGS
ncbi:hypothetical protein Taro_028972 [Colocasia esculenta]|uniref:Clp R domain-containing protein n=1 Tax=Colocasia esculenta TaxID=4460 RepID=A0A843VYV5_COLES|nr:hypothetical protein [Colocasia esculenta]